MSKSKKDMQKVVKLADNNLVFPKKKSDKQILIKEYIIQVVNDLFEILKNAGDNPFTLYEGEINECLNKIKKYKTTFSAGISDFNSAKIDVEIINPIKDNLNEKLNNKINTKADVRKSNWPTEASYSEYPDTKGPSRRKR